MTKDADTNTVDETSRRAFLGTSSAVLMSSTAGCLDRLRDSESKGTIVSGEPFSITLMGERYVGDDEPEHTDWDGISLISFRKDEIRAYVVDDDDVEHGMELRELPLKEFYAEFDRLVCDVGVTLTEDNDFLEARANTGTSGEDTALYAYSVLFDDLEVGTEQTYHVIRGEMFQSGFPRIVDVR